MQKHKPPSRIRYEKKHPTISFRLDREIKERLKKTLKDESFADFVKEALGAREREKKTLENAYNEGYHQGFSDGYKKGKRDFGVYTSCAICGERIIVTHLDDKRALDEFMRDQGWRHASCVGRVERRRREYER